nr:unnamed protein product [Callosobruchus chinensis]
MVSRTGSLESGVGSCRFQSGENVEKGANFNFVWSAAALTRGVMHENTGKGVSLFIVATRAVEELSLTLDLTRRLHKDKPNAWNLLQHLEEHHSSEQLTSFLRSSAFKTEPEGFIMACQVGVLVYRSGYGAGRQAPETLTHMLRVLRLLYYHLRQSYHIDKTPVLPYVPGDIESVVDLSKQTSLLDHQHTNMFIIEFSAPAKLNIVSKEKETRTKHQELLGQLRKL